MVKENFKLLALVKFNDTFAFVLDKPITYKYKQLDRNTIIGECGGFYECYTYEKLNNAKAFGGHKFEIQLHDKSVVYCDGDWWGGFNNMTHNYLRGRNIKQVVVGFIDDLIRTYVFTSVYADDYIMANMILTYSDKIYEYYEYENDVIKPIRNNIESEYKQELYERIIHNGYRSKGKWNFENKHYNLKYININYRGGDINRINDFKNTGDYKYLTKIFGVDKLEVGIYKNKFVVGIGKYNINFIISKK